MATSRRDAGPDREPTDLPLDEVIRRYDGRWVLLKVAGFDEDHVPSSGHVIAHGTNKHIHAVMRTIISESGGLTDPYYLFAAYPRIRSGAGLQAALEVAAKEGDARARRLR